MKAYFLRTQAWSNFFPAKYPVVEQFMVIALRVNHRDLSKEIQTYNYLCTFFPYSHKITSR